MFVQVIGASCALCLVSLALCYRLLANECDEKKMVSACPADSTQVME